MNEPTTPRLSPRARRAVLMMLLIAAIAIPASIWIGQRANGSTAAGPSVGGDLHALASFGDRTLVGGHDGAGYRQGTAAWRQVDGLAGADVMGWAVTPTGVLAGGHAGLYWSDDDGQSFARSSTDLPVSDIHALGSSGDVVYLGSPEGGLYVSTDRGETFELRNRAGGVLMGNIVVDPDDPDVAFATSMQDGALMTTDGGTTWVSLGGPVGAMSVTRNPTNGDLVVVGMGETSISADSGKSWSSLEVPDGTAATAYTATGQLLVAALDGDRAVTYQQDGDTWQETP